MGGIVRVLLANRDDVSAVTVTDGMISAITMVASKEFKEYLFRPQTGSMTSERQIDEAAGTNYVQTLLALVFNRMETSKRLEIEALRKKAEGYEAIFEIRLNELKLALTAKVYEIFGIEYTFEIEEMPLSGAFMKKEEYLQRVDALCSELQGTLRTILMYREENAYTVVRRIEDINKVTRKLRSVENWLDRQ